MPTLQTPKERQKAIMAYLAKNPGAHYLDLWEFVPSITDLQLDANLPVLVKKGWIVQEGDTDRWSLTPEGQKEAEAQNLIA